MPLRPSKRLGVPTLLAAIAVALPILVCPADASADATLCPSGSGAGACERPQGVAVDTETGRVYVADRGNNRVDVFTASAAFLFAFGWGVADGTTPALQTCTSACFKGLSGTGAGQFSGAKGIAVDNDPSSPSFHDVYVFDGNNFRVEKFDPSGSFLLTFGSEGAGECKFSSSTDSLAIGPAGVVHVIDSVELGGNLFQTRLERFNPSGTCAGELSLTGTQRANGLAVDSTGSSYVAYDSSDGIRKYNSSGTLVFSKDPGVQVSSVAVDSADNLYAAQAELRAKVVAPLRVITEYDSTGAYLRRFGYGRVGFNLQGIAAYHAGAGDVLGSEEFVGSPTEGNRVIYLPFPSSGPISAPPTLEAAPVGNTKARLKAEINPEGATTEYHFEYVDQVGFEEAGFASVKTKSTPVSPLGGAADFKLHGVSAQIGCTNPVAEAPEGKCLSPETTYHFRVIATNANGGGEGTVVGPSFKTLAALEMSSWALEVGTDSAILRAEVNPLGIPTTGFFEYVDDAKYQASGFAEAAKAPASGVLEFGTGEAPVIGGTALSGLSLGTTYHYRFLAKDPLIEPVKDKEHTLRTFALASAQSCPANEAFRTGPSSSLPDCRGYEMVSPLDKENGDVIPLGEATTALPGTLDQSSISGDKVVYGSFRSFSNAESAAFTTQYLAARDGGGWSTHAIASPRGRLTLPVGSELDTELKALSPDLCDSWFKTVAGPQLTPAAVDGFSNIYRRHDEGCAGGKGYEALTTVEPPNLKPEEYFPLELQGLSADGKAGVYVANDTLTGDAPLLSGIAEKNRQLYYFAAGAPSFVCVLPNGQPSESPCQAGGPGDGLSRTATLNNAISKDGSRVFWTAYSGFFGPGRIYLRLNPGAQQSAISSGECSEPEKACTIVVSKKAEELSGAEASQFWAASTDGSRAVFTAQNLSSGVSDLYEFDVASETTRLIAHHSAGVLGAGEDAKWIYFVSEEALGGANAEGRSPVAGKQNLYLEREGALRFIGTLASADIGGFISAVNNEPRYRASRVSPDGRHAAFMSFAPLTGYDNHDAKTGQADAELYRYDANANGGEGGLLCVSCNPTNGRPVGQNIGNKSNFYPAAGEVPVWENTLYASRALSDDGSRLYFESSDGLVAADTNGAQDVYQWEEPGAGECTVSASSYVPANGGCIDLISSGKSARAAEFTDANPSGDDVFFATLASLLPQDYGLVDIYDARVGGGFPPPAPAEAHCEREACQGPVSPPRRLTPSSSTYRGPGNVGESPARSRACPARKHKVKGRCVKSKKSKKTKHRS